jgi:hypothetical protein
VRSGRGEWDGGRLWCPFIGWGGRGEAALGRRVAGGGGDSKPAVTKSKKGKGSR